MRKYDRMPMRGRLPLAKHRAVTGFADGSLVSVSSSEFAAVSAFAAAGLFASLYAALTHPLAFALVTALVQGI
jgi:hypothetical protein